MISRRDFCRQGSLLAAGVYAAGGGANLLAGDKCAAQSSCAAGQSARKIPIAVQLYSVREDCAKDLPGVLKQVGKMGYQGVEFAGYYNYTAAQLRAMLDENGLKCAGTHTGMNTLELDELEKTIEFNRTLGNSNLILPWVAMDKQDPKGQYLKLAEKLNLVDDKLQPHGMQVGYHNHDFEFKVVDGETIWDIFFSHTHSRVIMQLDTGNARQAGVDVAQFIGRYPGRAKTVHIKEYSATNKNALIGEGDVNWPDIFHLCETVGKTEWYIVEQESGALPAMECIQRNLETLRKMGKI